MQAPALVDLRRRSDNNKTNVVGFQVNIIFQLSRTITHASNSQNCAKYMKCSAVVISTAIESNHTADTGLLSWSTEFLTTQTDQSKRDVLIHYVLIYIIIYLEHACSIYHQSQL